MVYPALLPLIRTPRLPVVDWTDAPADLNGLVRFAERRNLFSARVPSHFEHSLPLAAAQFRFLPTHVILFPLNFPSKAASCAMGHYRLTFTIDDRVVCNTLLPLCNFTPWRWLISTAETRQSYYLIYLRNVNHQKTGLSDRAVVGLRPLACGHCGSESHRGHGCLSLVSVVCCQVEVSATGWSLVQMSPIDCGAFECDLETPWMRKPWPTGGLLWKKKPSKCALFKLMF